MARVRFRAEAIRSAAGAAEAVYPEEACGFLLGSEDAGPEGSDRVVRLALSTPNRAPERRGERFLIPADEVRRVCRTTRSQTDRVIGFFHSHPDRSTLPSRLDDEEAWPRFTYLILSVIRGRFDFARAFELDSTTDTLLAVAHRLDGTARAAPG